MKASLGTNFCHTCNFYNFLWKKGDGAKVTILSSYLAFTSCMVLWHMLLMGDRTTFEGPQNQFRQIRFSLYILENIYKGYVLSVGNLAVDNCQKHFSTLLLFAVSVCRCLLPFTVMNGKPCLMANFDFFTGTLSSRCAFLLFVYWLSSLPSPRHSRPRYIVLKIEYKTDI